MKPIHFASVQGNVKTFKVLIKLGSDPRSPTQNDVCVNYKRLYLCMYICNNYMLNTYNYMYVAWKTAHSPCMFRRSRTISNYTS